MLDKKSISFLTLGLLLGGLLTTAAFSAILRPDAPQPGGGEAEPGQTQTVVLKLAHALDQGHPVHAALEFLAQRLQERSAGQVELEIFPNGQLGSETDTIEQVQRGALAMAKTSAAALEGFVPEMALFGLPYLFRDEDHYWAALQGEAGKQLLRAGRSVGFDGLCYYDSGSRSFYTIGSPVLSPNDLQGRKIRVMRSRTSMDMVSEMGGAPTPIPWGELYTALQQGMVDGAENNPPSLLTSRHFEVTKYYSLDEHTRIPDVVILSHKVFENLSPQVRRWLEAAAAESVTFQRKLWSEKTREAMVALEQAGVQISRPDKAPFARQVAPMYDAIENPSIKQLVEQIRAIP